MRTIVIDVQLAPCEIGIDIFKPSDKLHQDGSHYRDETNRSRPVAIRCDEFPGTEQITKPTLAQLVIKLPREEGYYWVRNKSKWQIALWSPSKWYLACNGIGFDDNNFDEINETKIERTT